MNEKYEPVAQFPIKAVQSEIIVHVTPETAAETANDDDDVSMDDDDESIPGTPEADAQQPIRRHRRRRRNDAIKSRQVLVEGRGAEGEGQVDNGNN